MTQTNEIKTPMFRASTFLPAIVAVAVCYLVSAASLINLTTPGLYKLGSLIAMSFMLSILTVHHMATVDMNSPDWRKYATFSLAWAAPISFGGLLGLFISQTSAKEHIASLALVVALTFVVAIVCAGLMTLAVMLLLHTLIEKPLRWVLGLKDTDVQAAQTEVGPVEENPGSNEASQYKFDVTRPTLGFDSMAGMEEFKSEVTQFIKRFDGYKTGKVPVSDTNGILLSGPAGTGKTTVANLIAGELGLPIFKIGNQDLTRKWVNESARVVKALFEQASKQPCVIFFDEFESVARDRSGNGHEEDKKVVTALLDEIVRARSKHIVLVAATNYPEQIDAAICRDGRFDLRIDVPYPDAVAREAILRGLMKKYGLKASEDTIRKVAQLWERRSPAFIDAVAKRMRDTKMFAKTEAVPADFKTAARSASRRASNIPRNGAKLSEIALPAAVRKETDSLIYRLKNWEEIAEKGGSAPSGVLLYGPPGTGKTNLARAVARELGDWHIFEVNTPEVLQNPSKFKEVVELAATHRPAIVFIDEADDLLRERVNSPSASATNEILKSMDGMLGKVPEVVFMAATNNVEAMDTAALRGGRFAEKIYMGRLTGTDLTAFLEKTFKSMDKVTFDEDVTPQTLTEYLRESAPADILTLLTKAVNYTLAGDHQAQKVGMLHINMAYEATQV